MATSWGALAMPALVALQVAAAPALALELDGQTWFRQPPWKVTFTNYYTYVGQTAATYYFTLTLPEQAGAGLGGLVIQQTRGVDRNFQFAPARTRAFVGLPRREGEPVAVQTTWDPQARRITVQFPQPPQPGQTITLALKPWNNPFQSDTYLFSVQALPAGPNPVAASLGFATMPIFDGVRF
ncbi:MAG: hypothetical protein RLZZ247_1370 [Cyanobacteriota bacterium]|jgi:hypothetical protein